MRYEERWGEPGRRGHRHGAIWVERRGGPPWGPERRMRRGNIRAMLLAALVDGPAHGYELIRRLEERSGGAWRPSPGSVYPTLQLLEEQGVVRAAEVEGKRVFELTDEGRQEAEAAKAREPWGEEPTGSRAGLGRDLRLLASGLRQVAVAGSQEQVAAAGAIVKDARQRLFRLLAEE